jgi:membrane protein
MARVTPPSPYVVEGGEVRDGAECGTQGRSAGAAPDPKARPFSFLRSTASFLREVGEEFQRDDCPRLAAAMSFYTVLALPPLLVLLLTLAGAVLNPAEVQQVIERQFGQFVGPSGTRQVQAILRNLQPPRGATPLATILSILGLLFGATGAFVQLQTSLNKAWEIAPDPELGGMRSFFGKRFTSFVMVLGVGAVLLSSVALNTTVSAYGDTLADVLPGQLSAMGLRGLSLVASFAVVVLLFATIFKLLPDAVLHWRDVGVGATVTALLFVTGKVLFGIYLGQSDPGSAYGAAGSLAVLLLWIYFSSMLLLLGAEFTQVWARHHGVRIVPQSGAICTRGERVPASAGPGWQARMPRWMRHGG